MKVFYQPQVGYDAKAGWFWYTITITRDDVGSSWTSEPISILDRAAAIRSGDFTKGTP